MCVNPRAFCLFGNGNSNGNGVLVRYVELQRGAITAERVRTDAQKNRIYSTWERDRLEALRVLQASLSLASLFKKPPPVWAHPSIVAEFGDAYLEGSGVEGGGGGVAASVAVFGLLLDRLVLQEGHGYWENFSHSELQATNYVGEAVKAAVGLCRRFSLAEKSGSGGGAQLVHYIYYEMFQSCVVSGWFEFV